MNKTGTIITTLHRISGDTIPLSHIVNHLTNIQLHILLFFEQPIEELIDWEKRMEALEEEFEQRI